MREFKFRAWESKKKEWICIGFNIMGEMMMGGILFDRPIEEFNNVEVEQFTGLKDKNGHGLIELYEGDIVSSTGEIIGTIHEGKDKRAADLVIESMGTRAWRDTEQAAIRLGFNYAK